VADYANNLLALLSVCYAQGIVLYRPYRHCV